MKLARSLVPWLWTAMLGVLGLILVVGEVAGGGDPANLVPGFVLSVLFTALGSLIIVRQAGNTIGWLLLMIGAGLFYTGILPMDAEPESASLLTVGLLVLDNWVGLSLIFYPLTLILYLFPDGHFFTSRQAWAGRIGRVMVPANLLVALFIVEIGPPFPSDPKDQWTVTNPIGFLPSAALDLFMTIWGVSMVFIAAFGVWSLTTRYRRSSALVKAQVRWMLLAASILVVAFVMVVFVNTDGTLFGIFVSLAFAFVPVSITIAITRYRLFEIDRIISRTISYALVVALLAGVFFGIVVVVGSFLPTENPLVVAGATLAVAALFNPLRRRIQHSVDRRFNRSGYQAEAVSEEFAARLRQQLSSQEIMDLWKEAVQEALQPQSAGVWLKDT